MNIVIDTNVVVSGVFFGGYPQKILKAVIYGKCNAYASLEIFAEYENVIHEMVERKQGNLNDAILNAMFRQIAIILPYSRIKICRDKDDNKFLECAKDSDALYIVSGDKDLLSIKEYDGIRIVTAKEFFDQYLKSV